MSQIVSRPGPLEGVTFASKDLLPPSNVYIGPDDAIVVTTYGSVTGMRVDARGRVLRADGVPIPFEISDVPNSDRTAHTTVIPVGEGFLLNVAVFLGSGSAKRGQCYVVVGISRGIQTSRFQHTIVAQGYVATGVNQAWPGSRLEQPTEGPGCIRSVTGTDPAPGAELNETVPTGARWQLLLLRASLATSAAVANRRPSLIIGDATNALFITTQTLQEPASSGYGFHWARGMALETTIGGIASVAGLPAQVPLLGGYKITTQTSAIDVNDNWGAPQMLVEEWIEP